MTDLDTFRSQLVEILDTKGFAGVPDVLNSIGDSRFGYNRPALANLKRAGTEPAAALQQGDYITRIKIFITTLTGDTDQTPPDLPIPPSFFLGREQKLREIHHLLTDPWQHENILLLSSIGGMGKTTLMQQYLSQDQCRGHFSRIIYLSVDKNLEKAFVSGVSNALGLDAKRIDRCPPDERLKLVTAALRDCKEPNLCVIDNLTHSDFDDLRRMHPVLAATGWKFLITSRTVPDGFLSLDVDELDIEDAALLFTYHYYTPWDTAFHLLPQADRNARLRQKIQEAGIKSDLLALLTHIVRHTLLTELLAKSANKKGLEVNQLLPRLEDQDFRHPDLQRVIYVHPHAATTHKEQLNTATLHVYLLNLFETEYLVTRTGDELKDNENEARATMLRFFSLLPSTDIPIDDLKRLWGVEKPVENGFENRLDELRQIGWIGAKREMRPAVPQLQNLAYKMHPLVQEVVYEKLNPNIDNCRPLVKTITEILSHMLAESLAYQNYAKSIGVKLKLLNKKS